MPSGYGAIISVSILLCILLAQSRTKFDGKQPDKIWDVALWTIIPGLLGARLYHVVHYWDYYSTAPTRILYFWQGGLGIWGAVIGGMLGIIVYTRLKKEPLTYWLDLACGVVPLGQAVGRWGNFFNQEAFGKPTSLPWGIFIKLENRPLEFKTFERFHPLFLYESILNFGLFITLSLLAKKHPRGTGKVALCYLIGYSIIRLILEFLRVNPWKIDNFNVAQASCLAVLFFSLLFLKIKATNPIG